MLNGVGDKVDWQQAAATGRDMQLIELMNLSTTEVWNSLAPGLNGMLSIEANRSNSETGERTFKNFSIYPMHFGLAAKMTHDILPAFGDNLVCRFDDVRVTDRALRIKEQEAYERVHPIDEVRQEFYQDDPIGDERGNKLVAEIKSQASPFGQPPLAEEARDVEQDKEERDNKAYLEEMGKFRRYALKRIGKEMKFTSNIIPSGQLEGIAAKLKGCGTEKAVNTVFDGYLDGETDNGAADVIKGMALAVEAIKAVTMFKKEQ
jgi:hypothetical protein